VFVIPPERSRVPLLKALYRWLITFNATPCLTYPLPGCEPDERMLISYGSHARSRRAAVRATGAGSAPRSPRGAYLQRRIQGRSCHSETHAAWRSKIDRAKVITIERRGDVEAAFRQRFGNLVQCAGIRNAPRDVVYDAWTGTARPVVGCTEEIDSDRLPWGPIQEPEDCPFPSFPTALNPSISTRKREVCWKPSI
jgi:hypothetical protein